MMVTPEQVTFTRDLLHLSIPDPFIAREVGLSGAHVYAIRVCHDLTTENVVEMLVYVVENMVFPEVYAWCERVHTGTPLRVFVFPGDRRPAEAEIRAQVPQQHRWRRVDYIYVSDDADAVQKRRKMRTNMVAFATESADSSIDGSNIKQLPSRRKLAVDAWRARVKRTPELNGYDLPAHAVRCLGQLGDKELSEFEAMGKAIAKTLGIGNPLVVRMVLLKLAGPGGIKAIVEPLSGHYDSAAMDGWPTIYLVDGDKYRLGMQYIPIPEELLAIPE